MDKKTVITGRKPVLEYLQSMQAGAGALLHVAENAHGKIIDTIKKEASRRGVPVQKSASRWFSAHAAGSSHQGVALEVQAVQQPHTDEDSLLEAAAESKGVIVVCDQLTDPHNVGAIIRSVEALGGSGVVLQKANAPGITGTVIKSAAGATAHLPVVHVTNIARFLEDAKKKGLWVIGTAGDGETPLTGIHEYLPAVIVIGSEGEGMRRLVREKCDVVTAIPLRGHVGSLNASVAAGIVVYEVLR